MNKRQFEFLKKLILARRPLKEEDRDVVCELIDHISIGVDPGFVNSYLAGQVENEVASAYLVNRYRILIDKLDEMIEEHRADRFFELGSRSEEGYKWTKRDKEDFLLSDDVRYRVLVEDKREMQRLLTLLEDLRDIVFSRQRKLEELSVNYRQESKADRRH